jgi:hypothetical protein
MGLDKLYQLDWAYNSVLAKLPETCFIHPIESPKKSLPDDEYNCEISSR